MSATSWGGQDAHHTPNTATSRSGLRGFDGQPLAFARQGPASNGQSLAFARQAPAFNGQSLALGAPSASLQEAKLGLRRAKRRPSAGKAWP